MPGSVGVNQLAAAGQCHAQHEGRKGQAAMAKMIAMSTQQGKSIEQASPAETDIEG